MTGQAHGRASERSALWSAIERAVRQNEAVCRVAGPSGTFAVLPEAQPERWAEMAGAAASGPVSRAFQDGRPHVVATGALPGFLLADPVLPLPQLVVAGAGHVAEALVPVAKAAGFSVTVVDDRPGFAAPGRFPGARVAAQDMVQFLQGMPGGPRAFVIVASRSHALDRELLRVALSKRLAYLGVLASRRRAAALREELGLGEMPQALRGPVGLPIGSETPAEIAVSIVAELVAVRRGAPPFAGGVAVPCGDAESHAVWQALAEATARGERCALATVVRVEGSTPRGPGARMLVREDGGSVGTIGGGEAEARVRERCVAAMARGKSGLERLSYEEGQDAPCGGTAEVFVEPACPEAGEGTAGSQEDGGGSPWPASASSF